MADPAVTKVKVEGGKFYLVDEQGNKVAGPFASVQEARAAGEGGGTSSATTSAPSKFKGVANILQAGATDLGESVQSQIDKAPKEKFKPRFSEAEVLALAKAGKISREQADEYLAEIYRDKDPMLLELAKEKLSAQLPARNALDYSEQNRGLTDIRSRLEAGQFGKPQAVGSFGDEYLGAAKNDQGNYEGLTYGVTSPQGGGAMAGRPFVGGLQLNSGQSTQGFQQGSLASTASTRGDNLFNDAFYNRDPMSQGILGQRGLTGSGNMINDAAALGQSNALIDLYQSLYGLDNAYAQREVLDDLKANPAAKKKGYTDLLNAAVAPEDEVIQPYARGGVYMAGKPRIVGEEGPEIDVPNTSGTIIPNPNTDVSLGREQPSGSGWGGASPFEMRQKADEVARKKAEEDAFLHTEYRRWRYPAQNQLNFEQWLAKRQAAAAAQNAAGTADAAGLDMASLVAAMMGKG
ncbi:MAG TPA: hypothetical protein VJB57_18585, partial [Dehalococcoidia bacterium]|nr:hypothetical protein [Dehalococcoidia bacterium]